MTATVLAIVGVVLVVVAAALIYLPAGIALAGIGCLAAAYLTRYLEVRGEISRTSR